jgi:hypothetical protein
MTELAPKDLRTAISSPLSRILAKLRAIRLTAGKKINC